MVLVGHNVLYNKQQNRRLADYKIRRLAKNDMTFILGARCTDGVVLIGDTKITIDEGADYTYGQKISRPFPNGPVIMGAAGMGGLYKDFSNRVLSSIMEMENRKDQYTPITTEEQFEVLVNRVIRGMHDDFGEDRHIILNNLMVMCASRINGKTGVLTVFTPYGFPEPVMKARAIGHGEPYGALFLKKMWREKTMTMEATAKLGVFIIKLIQEMKLDNSVGFNDEYLPQVFYVPDVIYPNNINAYTREETQEFVQKNYPIKDLKEEEIKHIINEIGSKISDFEDFFKQGKFKL